MPYGRMAEYVSDLTALLREKATYILVFFAAITVLSWLKTGREALEWSASKRRSGLVNLSLVGVNAVAIMLPLLATGLLLNLLRDMPHVPAELWQDTPLLVRAFAALFIVDIANYALHRLSHANAWLWPMHAVHHSDTDMHFLSANRAHILEWLILIPVGAGVAYLCGLSVSDVAFLGLVREFHQYYVHSSLDWSHGPLRYVIAGPRFHRWHHVDQPEAYNKNFSLFFPFIDLAFGTYHVPGPSKGLATGFEDNPGDRLGALLLYPFQAWAGLAKARRQSPVR